MVKEKKAQAHVEMILSFSLFIGALLFIFMFLNPFAEVKGEISNTNKIYESVKTELTSDIGKLSIIIPPPLKNSQEALTEYTETCSGTSYSGSMSKEAINALLEDYRKEYGGEYIVLLETPNRYIVYFNEIFGSSGSFDPGINGECIPGIYTKEKMFVAEKIQNLFVNDYNGLKQRLGVSDDFLLIFMGTDNQEIPELNVPASSRKNPQGVNVASDNFPIRMMYNNGTVQELILNVRGW